jgi:hypothetical protein
LFTIGPFRNRTMLNAVILPLLSMKKESCALF